jgi:two-component system, LytTR family, sensor kinase
MRGGLYFYRNFVFLNETSPMTALALRRYPALLLHIVIWVLLGLMLLIFLPLTWNITLPAQFWVKQSVLFVFWVGAYYLNTLVWVPRLLFRNKVGLYALSFLVTAIAVPLFVWTVGHLLNLSELMFDAVDSSAEASGQDWDIFRRSIIFAFFTTLSALGIGTIIAAVQKSHRDALLRQEEALLLKSLEQQKTSAELSFLKAQINPHFFFNTLNNIYTLTMTDVEASRQALLKLSRMMRYVLYETQKDRVMLSQELAFVQNYIELMQLRLTDKVEVVFRQPAPLADVPIGPMLLLPFVENAFKHGVSAMHASRICIAVRQDQQSIAVEVRNTLFTDQSKSLEEASGIGLANTRRRLDLLYPDRYTLSVHADPSRHEYQVHLSLTVS